VVLGVNDITDFNALHSSKHDHEMQLIAFEILAMDGDDLHRLSRKTSLARLLRGRPDGIFANPFEVCAMGPALFRKACEFGLEWIVSKRRDRPMRLAARSIGSK
jgi:bifunctional non-homologous end joining protein LigD